ncbi:UNVERIFIED_ORG: hypothetical protein QOE_3637, partial [Clostridioides difficile F501]
MNARFGRTNAFSRLSEMRRKDERLAACLAKRHRDLAASVKIEMMEKLINYGELGG